MKKVRQLGSLLVLLGLLVAHDSRGASEVGNVLHSPATAVPNAEASVIIDLARAEKRLVAVGERGLILLSDDDGKSWRQAEVPVSTTLTAVQFVDGQVGWAVGHSGVVLKSSNAGETWQLQLDGAQAAQLVLATARQAVSGSQDDEDAQERVRSAERLVDEGADKPFLAIQFVDAQHGIVVGAYGLAFRTADGGATWQSQVANIENPQALHLYAISRSGDRWYIAGEQGYLARSLDGGNTFQQMSSGYEGTFFTMANRSDGALVLGGLKGTAFALMPGADVPEAIHNVVPVSFADSIELADGRVLLANQSGALLLSDTTSPQGLQIASSSTGNPLATLIQAADGGLVLAGFTGLSRLSLPTTSTSE